MPDDTPRRNGRPSAASLARWQQYSPLSRILLVLSVCCTLAVVVVLVFALYLVIIGYSGGSSPTSVNGLAFPIAFILLGAVGLPILVVCVLFWVAFVLSARRGPGRSSGPGYDQPAPPSPGAPRDPQP